MGMLNSFIPFMDVNVIVEKSVDCISMTQLFKQGMRIFFILSCICNGFFPSKDGIKMKKINMNHYNCSGVKLEISVEFNFQFLKF